MTAPSHSSSPGRLDGSLIRHLPPFSKLVPEQIREVLDHATTKLVAQDQIVFAESDRAEHFFLLLDGYIRAVRLTESGEQVTALHIPPGQLFGIARALGKEFYPATAIAASECVILSWKMALWDDFALKFEGFTTETYRTVGNRVVELNNRLVELATLHVEQRVANVLLRLVNQAGRETKEGIEIDFPISRQDIAEIAGTTLHTVSRLLSGWKKSGIVQSSRKRIVLSKPHELVEISNAGTE
ncbi:MAG: Crp/Fnr family transcriptional regulator [Pseudomonadota bacterium]